jgi:hypothetical protein
MIHNGEPHNKPTSWDDLYHPLMGILGMVYYWVYHSIHISIAHKMESIVNINGMGQLWGIRIIDWLIFEAPIPRLLRVPQHKYLTLSRYISVMVKPSTEWSASEFRGLTSLTRMFSPHPFQTHSLSGWLLMAADSC